jgi:hypothetical protein
MPFTDAARSPADVSAPAHVAERILAATLVLAVAGVAVQTAVDLFDFWALDREVEALLVDSDLGVFAWASVVATFGVALGAFLLSLVTPERRSLLWLVVAVAAFLSLDDQVGIHERLGNLADRAESLARWEPARLLWPALYLPLLAALALALAAVARELPRPARRFVLAGLVLLAAAVALEVLSAGVIRAGHDRGSLLYELEVVLEEGAELAGWILIAGALLSAFALGLRPGLTVGPRIP